MFMPSQARITTLKKYLSWNIVNTSHNLVSLSLTVFKSMLRTFDFSYTLLGKL